MTVRFFVHQVAPTNGTSIRRKSFEETHGKNVLNLVIVVGCVKKLIDNARVVRFLAQNHPELLTEFQKLAESRTLTDNAVLHHGTARRTIGTLARTLGDRGDATSVFSAEIAVPMPSESGGHARQPSPSKEGRFGASFGRPRYSI